MSDKDFFDANGQVPPDRVDEFVGDFVAPKAEAARHLEWPGHERHNGQPEMWTSKGYGVYFCTQNKNASRRVSQNRVLLKSSRHVVIRINACSTVAWLESEHRSSWPR